MALLVAAGSGSRLGGEPKQYRTLGDKPLLAHAIDHLRHDAISEIHIVIADGQEAAFRAATAGRPLPPPIIGGATRRQSVRNGLEALAALGDVDRVLIHDAARPFTPCAVIDRLLGALDEHAGVVPVLAVSDTLARGVGRLGAPVDREGLVRVQTPQAFRFDEILAAHRAWDGEHEPTDDAQVAIAANLEVVTVMGDKALEKITYDSDLAEAAQRLRASMVTRVGMGFDVHAFAAGDHVWLGGICIHHSHALAGHSDADVVLHAITDALLGALGAGDIGDHFPPGDPQWRGAPSSLFLEHARDLVLARGGVIDHVDLTIICEAPKIGPHRDAMRDRIAAMLRLAPARISVKATTTERLGFTGRGEGIAAQAVATVRWGEG